MLIYQLPNPYVQQHAGVEELSGTLLLNNWACWEVPLQKWSHNQQKEKNCSQN